VAIRVGGSARVVGGVALASLLLCCGFSLAAEDGATDGLQGTVRSIHKRALQAKEKNDLELREDLRVERLAAIREATRAAEKDAGAMAWLRGYEAIQRADQGLKAMKYRDACQSLVEAWEPFANAKRGEPVFGDIAVKLFVVAQAASALHPGFTSEDEKGPVSEANLLKALQTAVDNDPCQVEAAAMLAFLEKPKPEEAFLPADQRPSLRDRNRILLDISAPKDMNWKFMPWFAPAEFLKAQSSSFVLDDLNYYTSFLNEKGFRLKGEDRFGEQFQVVLGGALLLYSPDEEGQSKKLAVARFLPATKEWQKVRLQLLVIQAAGVGEDIVVDEEAILRRIGDVATKFAQGQTDEAFVREKVAEISTGFEKIVQTHAKSIIERTESLDGRLRELESGFGRYGAKFPAHAVRAQAAQEQIAEMRRQFAEQQDARQEIQRALTQLPQFSAPGNAQPAGAPVSDKPPPPTFAQGAITGQDALNAWFYQRVDAVRLIGQQLQKVGGAPAGFDTLVEVIAMTTLMRRNNAICPALVERLKKEREGYDEEIEKINRDLKEVVGKASPERKRRYESMRRISAGLQKDFEKYQSLVSSALSGDFLKIPYRKALEADQLAASIVRKSRESGDQSVADAYASETTENNLAFERIKVLEALAGELREQKPLGGHPWVYRGLQWSIYDLPDDLKPDDVAAAIDALPRLGLPRDIDLPTVLDNAEKNQKQRGIAIKTLPEFTAMAGCPIGETISGGEGWNAFAVDPRDLLEPCYVVVLTPEDPAQAVGFGPAFSVDNAGMKYLQLQYDGRKVPFHLDEDADQPTLTAKFPVTAQVPCVDGVLRLQVGDGARFVKDSRLNTITRLDGAGVDRFYRIVSDSGRELSDRSVNYAKKDWRGLDRNIVNEFMPRVMAEHVALPVWKSYWSELQRRSPDGEWIWALPREAFGREGLNSQESGW